MAVETKKGKDETTTSGQPLVDSIPNWIEVLLVTIFV